MYVLYIQYNKYKFSYKILLVNFECVFLSIYTLYMYILYIYIYVYTIYIYIYAEYIYTSNISYVCIIQVYIQYNKYLFSYKIKKYYW